MNINRKNQRCNKIDLIMGGRGYGLRTISTSPITINNLSIIFKVIVANLLRPTSIATPTINSFVVMETIVNMEQKFMVMGEVYIDPIQATVPPMNQ